MPFQWQPNIDNHDSERIMSLVVEPLSPIKTKIKKNLKL